jgi:hypothetical protein
MTMMAAGILAVALQFHGVIGQSAGPSEEPLPFTGVTSLVELPGNRVVFAGDDGMLYEIRGGRPVATGRPAIWSLSCTPSQFRIWESTHPLAVGRNCDPPVVGPARPATAAPVTRPACPNIKCVVWKRNRMIRDRFNLPGERGHRNHAPSSPD